MEINVFRFHTRDVSVRCDNQYKTGADRGNILGQPRLFEFMGTCGLSPAHESEMRGYLVYVLIVKYLTHRLKKILPQYIRLDGLIVKIGRGGGGGLKHF